MAEISKPSVKKNFVLSTIYQILNLLVPFITAPYVSRVLGAEGIGVYSYTSSVRMYFSMFAALGTVQYGMREIARVRDDKNKLSQIFWEIECLVVLTSSIAIIIWGIWVWKNTQYQIIYLVLSLSLIGTMLDISWFFSGIEQFKYIVTRNSIIKILGVFLLFIFIKEKDDLLLYIFLMSLTSLLGMVSMWFYLPKMVNKPNIRFNKIIHHFRETLVYFVPTVAVSLYTLLNKVMIGAIGCDPKENGYYEQAFKIIGMAQTLAFTALNNVMGPRISYLFVENKEKEICQRINKSVDYALFMGVGIVLGVIAIAPRFIPWFFGPGYEKVIGLTQLLSIIVLVIAISNILGSQYYNPAGLRAKSARYLIIGAFTNLLISYFLIKRYSSYGAVISSLIAESVVTFLYLFNCNGYLSLKNIILLSWKKTIAGILMSIGILLLDSVFVSNTLAVLIEILFGIILYMFSLILLKDSFASYIIKDQLKPKLLYLKKKYL